MSSMWGSILSNYSGQLFRASASWGRISAAEFPHAKPRRTRRKKLFMAFPHRRLRKILRRRNSDLFVFFAASREKCTLLSLLSSLPLFLSPLFPLSSLPLSSLPLSSLLPPLSPYSPFFLPPLLQGDRREPPPAGWRRNQHVGAEALDRRGDESGDGVVGLAGDE